MNKDSQAALPDGHEPRNHLPRERSSLQNPGRLWRIVEIFLHHSPTPMAVLDRDFNFIRVSEAWARVSQKQPEYFPRRNFFELYPSLEARSLLEEAARSKKPYQAHATPFISTAGPERNVRYWDWILTPLLDKRGEVEALVLSAQDVTEHKKADLELEKYRDHLEDLVSERTRELTEINRMLEKEIADRRQAEEALRTLNSTLEQKVAERTEVAEQRSRQLQALVLQLAETEEQVRRRIADILHDDLQQLLSASRFQLSVLRPAVQAHETAKFILQQVDTLLQESIRKSRSLSHELSPAILQQSGLVAAVEWLARWMLDNFGLRVDVESADWKPLQDEAWRSFLFRAIQELLLNVARHSGSREARVQLTTTADLAHVTVTDRGRGFDPEVLEKPQKFGGGFGLLSINERIRYIGGSLKIESRTGSGSRLTLTLPLQRWDQLKRSRASRSGKKTPPPAPQENVSSLQQPDCCGVIVGEDHPRMRQGLASVLESQPDIRLLGQAATGLEALEMTRRLRPDVVVLDVVMPEMDGIEAARRIKSEMPQVRVIGLSMLSDDELAARMKEAGAESCLSKADAAEALLAAIRA